MGYGLVDAYAAVAMASVLPKTPSITADRLNVASGQSVTFTVRMPQQGVTFEWQDNRISQVNQSGPSLTLTVPFTRQSLSLAGDNSISPNAVVPHSFMVRCRAINNGTPSDWSSEITVPISYSTQQ